MTNVKLSTYYSTDAHDKTTIKEDILANLSINYPITERYEHQDLSKDLLVRRRITSFTLITCFAIQYLEQFSEL